MMWNGAAGGHIPKRENIIVAFAIVKTVKTARKFMYRTYIGHLCVCEILN